MTAPNMEMEAITASLERSLQNCSLNNNNQNHQSRREEGSATDADADADADAGIGISSSSDDVPDNHISNSDTALELNSHISLPYHWEQCLDLKVQFPSSSSSTSYTFHLLPHKLIYMPFPSPSPSYICMKLDLS